MVLGFSSQFVKPRQTVTRAPHLATFIQLVACESVNTDWHKQRVHQRPEIWQWQFATASRGVFQNGNVAISHLLDYDYDYEQEHEHDGVETTYAKTG